MTTRTPLSVKHTVDRFKSPLLCIDNLPGEGAELTPSAARAVAHALLTAAADCEANVTHTARYGAVRRTYSLES